MGNDQDGYPCFLNFGKWFVGESPKNMHTLQISCDINLHGMNPGFVDLEAISYFSPFDVQSCVARLLMAASHRLFQ